MKRKTKKNPKKDCIPDKETISKIPHIKSSTYYIIKWIAIITMVIDHTAYLLSDSIGLNRDIYVAMRMIGGISFPLFNYLLVECFFFTSNRKKHFWKIVALAFLSEIPFNVFKEVRFFTLGVQNVCFELAACFLLLCLLNKDSDTLWVSKKFKKKKLRTIVSFFVKFDIWCFMAVILTFLNVDYAWRGVLLTSLLFVSKKRKHTKLWQLLALTIYAASFLDLEYIVVIVALAIIYLAEIKQAKHLKCGRVGAKIKEGAERFAVSPFSRAFGKAFYPVHLIVLIAIRLAFAN